MNVASVDVVVVWDRTSKGLVGSWPSFVSSGIYDKRTSGLIGGTYLLAVPSAERYLSKERKLYNLLYMSKAAPARVDLGYCSALVQVSFWAVWPKFRSLSVSSQKCASSKGALTGTRLSDEGAGRCTEDGLFNVDRLLSSIVEDR